MQRATKIVATIGPASSDRDTLTRMIKAGVNVVRLNFSHGKAQDHIDRATLVREVADACGVKVAIMADLQGPKIRVGKFENGKINLENGDKFILDADCTMGNQERVGLDYKALPRDLKGDDVLLLNDGLIVLVVERVLGNEIHTVVKIGGELSNNKGINRQGGGLSAPALTAKDMDDIRTAMSFQADYVAVSFPKNATDMEMARQLGNVAGEPFGHKPLMIAKIERAEAIPLLQEILDASDGLMVARGDLGVEMPPEDVPGLQKSIVHACRQAGKPVVVATQMLESMISSPTPTRAETSDVATAVYDGADAVMLSAESASGAYPVEAVQMMNRIIAASERDLQQGQGLGRLQRVASLTRPLAPVSHRSGDATDALCAAIHAMAQVLPLAATVAYTTSGSTTLRVAHERSWTPVLSLTPDMQVARMLTLAWGVHSICSQQPQDVDDMIQRAALVAAEQDFQQQGKPILLVAGTPVGVTGSANLLRIIWPDEAGMATNAPTTAGASSRSAINTAR
nr:pyruvate kinase [Herbaspirillum hiltneri]